MSRFLTSTENGEKIEEIESVQVCKWRINDICCNYKSDCLGNYPYPSSICKIDEDGKNYACACFQEEDGIIK